jgi:hypothetical protein
VTDYTEFCKLPIMQQDKSAAISNRYLYHLVGLYWIIGLLVFTFGVAFAGNIVGNTDSLLRALFLNYTIGIAFVVAQTYSCNIGTSLLFSIATLCLPLLSSIPYFLPITTMAYSLLTWRRWSMVRFSLGCLYWRDICRIIVAGSAFAGLVLASDHYLGFSYDRDLVLDRTHIDPIFHSAIASMIRTYGVVSTGLHGLIPLQYHAFSHFLLAAMSYAVNMPVFAAYGTIYLVAIVPLLIVLVVATAESFQPSCSNAQFTIRLLFVVLSFGGFLGYLPDGLFYRYGLWGDFFVSESYTIGLICLLGMMASFRIGWMPGRLVVMVSLLALATVSKVSVGAIALVLLMIHIVVFERCYWLLRAFVGLVSILVVGSVGWVAPSAAGQALGGEFLHLLRVCGILPGTWWGFDFWSALIEFNFIHFFFTWLFAVVVLDVFYRDRENTRMWIEPILLNSAALIVGWLVAIFISVPGGSEVYFSNVSMFVALPFVAVGLSSPDIASGFLRLNRVKSLICRLVVLTVGCIGFFLFGFPKVSNFWTKTIIQKSGSVESPFGDYLNQLRSIRDDLETRNLAVYIAKEETGFWGGVGDCKKASLIIPSVAERSAIFCLPDRRKCVVQHYGFSDYGEKGFSMSASPRLPNDVLVSEAMKLGFSGYIVVRRHGWEVHSGREDGGGGASW